jgi:hypothetical protein
VDHVGTISGTQHEDPMDAVPLPPFGLIFVVVIALILLLAVYARR